MISSVLLIFSQITCDDLKLQYETSNCCTNPDGASECPAGCVSAPVVPTKPYNTTLSYNNLTIKFTNLDTSTKDFDAFYFGYGTNIFKVDGAYKRSCPGSLISYGRNYPTGRPCSLSVGTYNTFPCVVYDDRATGFRGISGNTCNGLFTFSEIDPFAQHGSVSTWFRIRASPTDQKYNYIATEDHLLSNQDFELYYNPHDADPVEYAPATRNIRLVGETGNSIHFYDFRQPPRDFPTIPTYSSVVVNHSSLMESAGNANPSSFMFNETVPFASIDKWFRYYSKFWTLTRYSGMLSLDFEIKMYDSKIIFLLSPLTEESVFMCTCVFEGRCVDESYGDCEIMTRQYE